MNRRYKSIDGNFHRRHTRGLLVRRGWQTKRDYIRDCIPTIVKLKLLTWRQS